MGVALFVVAACVMLPATVWHYAGYWNGRYDPPPTPEPLTPCPDTSTVPEPRNPKGPRLMSYRCPTCGSPVPDALPREARYRPTHERVTVLRISNQGQYRPEDPGTGERLYAVQFPNGSTGSASIAELSELNGSSFRHSPLIPRKDHDS